MFSSWWSKGSAGSFSCELGLPIDFDGPVGAGVFSPHSGTKKATGLAVSVFACSDPEKFSSANVAVKRLKTLRHPSVLTFVDSGKFSLREKSFQIISSFITFCS